jgi:RNA polymerase-associated protein RTF1
MSESDDGNNAPKDKARAMPQSEIEREQALAEQATVVERDQQQRLLMQLLDKKHMGSAKAGDADTADKKRKAAAVEPEDTQRKSARLKSVASARKGLERMALSPESERRQRERKSTPVELKSKAESPKSKGAKKNESPSAADARAKANGDGKFGKLPSQSSQARISSSPPAEEPPSLRDFERVKLGRAAFAELCFYPGFEETAIGCIAKVVVGTNSRGENALKMGQITRMYLLPPVASYISSLVFWPACWS